MLDYLTPPLLNCTLPYHSRPLTVSALATKGFGTDVEPVVPVHPVYGGRPGTEPAQRPDIRAKQGESPFSPEPQAAKA